MYANFDYTRRIVPGTSTAFITPTVVAPPTPTFLLHCDGVDTSTSFIDATGNTTLTANGNAQIDTAQFKFGTGSGLFDGSFDYLSVDTGNSNFEFGTADFTIDFWTRPATAPGTTEGYFKIDYATPNIYLRRFADGTFSSAGTVSVVGTTVLLQNTWYHLAFVRSAGKDYIFVNGVLDNLNGTIPDDTTNYTSINASYPEIGMNDNSTFTNGWIDEFRMVNGTAAWTSNFTPPTAPYDPP